MNLKSHLSVSFVISALIVILFESWPLAVMSFISGVFIDMDHWCDFIYHRGFKLSPRKFFEFYNEHGLVKSFVVLHAWEWLVLLVAASWYSGWNPWLTGILIGVGHHMIFDQIFNPTRPLSYFMTYRIINKFDFAACFDMEKLKKIKSTHEVD